MIARKVAVGPAIASFINRMFFTNFPKARRSLPANFAAKLTLPLIYGSVDHWEMSRGNDKRMIHVENGIKIVSGRVTRQAALAGIGVTRLVDVYVQADINSARLVEILPSWSYPTPLSLLCPPLRYQLQRVSVLMDWFKTHFEAGYKRVLKNGPMEVPLQTLGR